MSAEDAPYGGTVGRAIKRLGTAYLRRRRQQKLRETRDQLADAYEKAMERAGYRQIGTGTETEHPACGHEQPRSPDQDPTKGIDRLRDETDCAFCQSLLSVVAELPEPERTKAVAEYGRFQGALEGGDEAAVKDAMRETEVLSEVVKRMRGIKQ